MNIALTEIQPIQPEPSSNSSKNTTDNDGFNKLFDQQLDRDSDLSVQSEYPQAIDNKNKINEIEGPENDSEVVLGEVGLTGDLYGPIFLDSAEPMGEGLTHSDLSEGLPVSVSIVNADGSAARTTVDGEVLPVNGNSLPPEAGHGELSRIRLKIEQPVDASRPVIPISLRAQATDFSPTDSEAPLLPGNIRESAIDEFPLSVKMDRFAVKLNTAQNGVQLTGLDITSVGDPANGFARTASLTSTGLQPNALPTQMETLSLSSTRDSAAISSGLGERIQWMVNHKLNTATIRMDPPMLGRLEVHIQLVDDVTQVTINTQHAQTRDLIDSASLRLREFLQENGHQNVNVDVSQEQQQTFEQSDDNKATTGGGEIESEEMTVDAGVSGERYFYSESVVDYFA